MINHYQAHNVLEELSLNAILQNLGISKGSFYYFFKNKDDLLYQAISPLVKERVRITKQNIKKKATLKEQFHLLFEPFIADNQNKLSVIEHFYTLLFSKESFKKSSIFRKLHIEIIKNRKILLLQSMKSNGIKVDKKLILLLDYIDTTIAFYYLYNKILHNKNTQNEISTFIDMMCDMIEKQYKK
ncbi:hypothetical protein CCY99_08855 [Helicobacter sp. 16-1353]|nr:hypothetical protein CCY99_08855 [Helicobacter sp. 16-1353]